MKEDVKRLWVEALRSGEYEQGYSYLKQDGKYCCLGVLCELAVQKGVTVETVKGVFENNISVLPRSVMKWAGLETIDGLLPKKALVRPPEVSRGNQTLTSLAEVNDSRGFDFDSIADIIEEQF